MGGRPSGKTTGERRGAATTRFAVATLVLTLGVIGSLVVDSSAASGASIVVVDARADGAGTCPSLSVSRPTCNLRAAIDLANDSRSGVTTIRLAAGEHSVWAPLFVKRSYTIAGTALPLGSAGASVIDVNGIHVLYVSADDVTVTGIAMQGNDKLLGASAIYLADSADRFVLRDSTIATNRAWEGGGLYVSSGASATVDGSTFTGNRAEQKGGAIRSYGQLTVVNSTFTQNAAKYGGAIATSGQAAVSFATIVDNTSDGAKGAGVARVSGDTAITASILGRSNGQAASGADCSGSPDLIGPNYVSNPGGCDVTNAALATSAHQTLEVGSLGDYEGPTATIPLRESSLGVDLVPTSACMLVRANGTPGASLTVDQRDAARPHGAACDLGAFEVTRLEIELALSSDTDHPYVGADLIPSEAILPSIIATDSLFQGSLAASPLSAFPLESAPLNAFPLNAFPLNAFPLSAFPLSAFATASAPLSAFPLSAFPLNAFPLDTVALSELVIVDGPTWDERLQGSAFEGVPLQSLTLHDVRDVDSIRSLSLGQLDIGSTPLSAFPLSAFLLSSVPLNAFPLSAFGPDVADWCDVFADFCDAGSVDPANSEITLASVALAGAPLSAFPLSAFPLNAFPLNAFPLSAFPMNSVPLSAFNWAATPLSAFPMSAFAPSTLTDVVDCGRMPGGTCANSSLGDASSANAFVGGSTMGTLGALFESDPAAMAALGDLTLADLIAGTVPVESVAWEQVDLTMPGIQNAADPDEWSFEYVADVALTAAVTALEIELRLPAGFAFTPGGSTFDGVPISDPVLSCANPASPGCLGERIVVTFTLPGASGGEHQLRIPVRARLSTGPATADARATASAGASPVVHEDSHTVEVVAPERRTVAISATTGACDGTASGGDVHLGWAGTSDSEVDVYRFEVSEIAASCGTSADIYLSNLPIDFDLVLYGAASEPIRRPPVDSVAYLDDVVFDLNPFDDAVQADTVQDVPQTLPAGIPDSATHAVVAVSSNRGLADEHIRTGTLRAGTYYLQVSAYNGGSSDEPYALRVRTESSTTRPTCAALPPPTTTPGSLPATLPAGVNSLFLVNTQLLEQQYGSSGRETVLNTLTQIADAAEFGVIGAVIPVDGDAAVRAAYAARLGEPCDPALSNDVVQAIGGVLDGYTTTYPAIENIVLVGDDRQIPMANIVDDANFANERTFAQEFSGNNESIAALAAGMYRSDDPYGTSAGIRVRDHELFVPDRAVGRLGETPEQIAASIDSFLEFGGRLDPGTERTAFQSGYEFLEDGAQLNALNLERWGYDVDTLLGTTWSDDDLATALATHHDVVGIHAHFDQNHALPALDNFNPPVAQDDLFESAELPPAVDRSVVYSMGCHSGYSVSDVQVGAPVADWPQAVAGERSNVFAGNTGFGYGDTDVVALTEQLTAYFADEVGRGGSVGAAWVAAKQHMLGSILVLDAYQEKSLQQFVLYGLPMFHVDAAPPDLSPTPQLAPLVVARVDLAEEPADEVVEEPADEVVDEPADEVVDEVVDEPADEVVDEPADEVVDEVVEEPVDEPMEEPADALELREEHAEEPIESSSDVPVEVPPGPLGFRTATVSLPTDPRTGLAVATIEMSGAVGAGFTRHDEPDGSYYDFNGSTVTVNGRPIQPLYQADLPEVAGQRARDALITGLTSSDVDSSFDPLFFSASPAYGGPRPEFLDGSFPAEMAAVRTVGTTGRTRQHLLLSAGQYLASDSAADRGTQRLHGSIEATVYYADEHATDFVAPTIDRSTGVVDDDAVMFEVAADGTARRVYVLYRAESDPEFRGLDLSIDGNVWRGVGAISQGTGDVEFIVQAVDDVGNVAMSNAKSRYFLAVAPGDLTPIALSASGPKSDPSNPWFTGDVSVTADNGGTSGIRYRIDAGEFQTYVDSITIRGSETGAHMVDAVDDAATFARIEVLVDAEMPTLTATAPTGWNRGPVSIALFADDASGSGVDRILYSTDGSDPSVVYVRPFDVSSQGARVRAVAVDVAGNVSTPLNVYPSIDTTRPVASLALLGAAGGRTELGSAVTAQFGCTDALSGVASCSITVDGVAAPGAARVQLPTSAPGVHVVRVVATDLAGNTHSASATYTVVAPTPYVISVSSTADDGTYGIGDTIMLVVRFSAPVDVVVGDQPPILLLDTEPTRRTATYVSGSGTATLLFAYTVQRGDLSADLDYTSDGALLLNGGSIRGVVGGGRAVVSLPPPGSTGSLAGQRDLTIDGLPPTVVITVASDSIKTGETSLVTFTFSEPVVGFTNDDLEVPYGTLTPVNPAGSGRLTQAATGAGPSGRVWSATFTPTPGVTEGGNVIAIDMSGVSDLSGNAGVGRISSNSFEIDVPLVASEPPVPTTIPVATELPPTGSGSMAPLLRTAVLLLAVGAIIVAFTRRRRPTV